MNNQLISLMLLAITLCVGACSSSESEETIEETDNKFFLSVSKEAILADGQDETQFSVCDSKGNDITDACQFSINGGDLISDKSFKTTKVGKYLISAYYHETYSESVTIEAIDPNNLQFTLHVDRTRMMADGGDLVQLKVMDGERDFTKSATFFANDEQIKSNIFRTTIPGNYTFTAQFKGMNVNGTKTVEAKETVDFTHRLLMEAVVSSGCSACPDWINKLKKLTDKESRIIVIESHVDFNGSDPLTTSEGTELYKTWAKTGALPHIRVARGSQWDGQENSAIDMINTTSPFNLSIETQINGSDLEVTAHVVSKNNYNNAGCVIQLVEDNVAGLRGHIYNNVLRKALPSIWGEKFDLTANCAREKKVTFSLKGVDIKKCRIIVAALGNDAVRNVQQVSIGESIGYK